MCLIIGAFAVNACAGNQDVNAPVDFLDMSIEELMNIKVTSVSKKEEKSFKTPAAVYVITREDIRRSGATSIPEALRMVPGIEVAKVDNNKWAITSRGLNYLYEEKLLVLIDGRSVYTPLFDGVYWDVQDVVLEDVDRIEVVRGPGGTLWGVNAVNGIINIITKNAKETQGTFISGGGGSEEKGFSSIRYGDQLDDRTYYRVYSKYFNRDTGKGTTQGGAADDSEAFRTGFRLDSDRSDQDHITIQGDFYKGYSGQKTMEPSLTAPFMRFFDESIDVSGGNVLTRWTREYSETSDMALQFYYDRTEREYRILGETRDTFDIDFQHHFLLDDRHNIIWGLGYRYTGDNTDGSFAISFTPSSRDDELYSMFVQDEITLVPDRLKFIIGSKFEENDYTGFEYQPSTRLLWTPGDSHTVWAAFTRAVQVPSRSYTDRQTNFLVINPALVWFFSGNDDLKSQTLQSYELGYRIKPKENVLVDITGFYNEYDHLYSLENNPTALNRIYDNLIYGETYGGEISAHWQVHRDWKLTTGYGFVQIQSHGEQSSTDNTKNLRNENSSPHNTFHLRSYLDLPGGFEFDTMLYYVDNVPFHDIPHYLRLDARLGWHFSENMELSAVMQNLLDPHHPEFDDNSVVPSEIQRGFFVELIYRF